MIHAHLQRQLGADVHLGQLDPDLEASLRTALEASRIDSQGRPVILVANAQGGASDALYVVEAGRLPDLLASSLAAQAGLVRRARRLIRKEFPDGLLPGSRPGDSRDGPNPVDDFPF